MEEKIMSVMINKINNQNIVKSSSFIETFSLKQGITKFGQKWYKATYSEIIQIHQITFYKPIKV